MLVGNEKMLSYKWLLVLTALVLPITAAPLPRPQLPGIEDTLGAVKDVVGDGLQELPGLAGLSNGLQNGAAANFGNTPLINAH
ncbi:hypothetical protein Dda_1114 [Drechslerella dactyloides]|uniref:Secreted protein n=1 Tax=Drechslerella dactyloides TaxID=74499 RepID=A0AAD6J7D9_DREDA|nr:hypothetical protein Dda_1114 [Drechslerella dactyloides]